MKKGTSHQNLTFYKANGLKSVDSTHKHSEETTNSCCNTVLFCFFFCYEINLAIVEEKGKEKEANPPCLFIVALCIVPNSVCNLW